MKLAYDLLPPSFILKINTANAVAAGEQPYEALIASVRATMAATTQLIAAERYFLSLSLSLSLALSALQLTHLFIVG